MTTAADEVEAALEFLGCRTPQCWFEQAAERVPELLIDHANCEKKAAGNALSLLYRYVDRTVLVKPLSRLAREELKHFEQVVGELERRGVRYRHLSSSRYAAGMRRHVRTYEPERLVDTLLVGAFVEARSCERFLGLAEALPEDLAGFYARLLTSEARHFEQYLSLAERFAETPIGPRLAEMRAAEARLVTDPDTELRFHSGPLAENTRAPDPRPEAP